MKMVRTRKRNAIRTAGLLALVIAAVLSSGICDAQRLRKGEWILPKHYPNGFHGIGFLDRISRNDMVVNDRWLWFSPSVTFHTPRVKNGSKAWFREGSYVGYLLNAQKEVVSLWLLDKYKPPRRAGR
jgi:hypothetical protein